MVGRVGIAPTSTGFQPIANLSQLTAHKLICPWDSSPISYMFQDLRLLRLDCHGKIINQFNKILFFNYRMRFTIKLQTMVLRLGNDPRTQVWKTHVYL